MSPSGDTVILVARGNNATADRPEDPGAPKVYRFADGVLVSYRLFCPTLFLSFPNCSSISG
jgi:hypothetical protein